MDFCFFLFMSLVTAKVGCAWMPLPVSLVELGSLTLDGPVEDTTLPSARSIHTRSAIPSMGSAG